MVQEPYFICDCGSDILAISHTWTDRRKMEEVGHVLENGQYSFDQPDQLNQQDNNHEWIAYCGGCGKGITVEWLPGNRIKIVLEQKEEM
jgi:hypothetical protein